jgi:hypothetical protein
MASIIEAILGVRTSPFRKGLDDAKKDARGFKVAAEKEANGLGAAFTALGGKIQGVFAGLAIGAFFKEAANYAGDLADQSDQLGISVERLQSFNKAFAKSGSGPEDVSRAFIELNKNTMQALDGDEKARAAFAMLGVELGKLADMAERPDEMMLALADGFAAAETRGLALGALTELLGKQAKKLGGNFKGVAADVREYDKALIKITDAEARANDTAVEWFGARWRDALAAGGKLTAMGVMIAQKLFDPEQWKKNLTGQQASAESINPAPPDAAAGLTDYQRGLVEKFGMDPKQAAKMRPGGDAQKSPKEQAEEKELHDTQHEREAQQGAHEKEAADLREKSADAALTTQQRLLKLSVEIFRLTEQQQGNDAVRTAELEKQKAALEAQRKELLTQQNLLSPDEKRQQKRDEQRKGRAARRADEQIAREVREEERRLRTGARRDQVRKGFAEERRGGDTLVAEDKVVAGKLDTIKTVLDGIKTNFEGWQ